MVEIGARSWPNAISSGESGLQYAESMLRELRSTVLPLSLVLLACAVCVGAYVLLAPSQTRIEALAGPQATPWGREAQQQMLAACPTESRP
jgi:hypothetical protein